MKVAFKKLTLKTRFIRKNQRYNHNIRPIVELETEHYFQSKNNIL